MNGFASPFGSILILKQLRYTHSWKKCLLRKLVCVECSFARCWVLLLFWHSVLCCRIWLAGYAVFFCKIVSIEWTKWSLRTEKSAGVRQISKISTPIYCYTSTKSLFQFACAALMTGNTRPSSAVLSKEKSCNTFSFLAECERSRENTNFLNYLISC